MYRNIANILGLETRVIGEPGRPVYAMLLDVTVPASVDGEALADGLTREAKNLGVDCSMHPTEADIF